MEQVLELNAGNGHTAPLKKADVASSVRCMVCQITPPVCHSDGFSRLLPTLQHGWTRDNKLFSSISPPPGSSLHIYDKPNDVSFCFVLFGCVENGGEILFIFFSLQLGLLSQSKWSCPLLLYCDYYLTLSHGHLGGHTGLQSRSVVGVISYYLFCAETDIVGDITHFMNRHINT